MANIEKRTTKDGKTRYRALVRLKGASPQSATFERLTDARKWVQDTESAIRDGRHFKTSEAKRHTLAEAIDRYVVEVMPRKPRSASDQTQQLEWWKNQIGCRVLADVTSVLLAEYRNRLSSEPLPDIRSGPGRLPAYDDSRSWAIGQMTPSWPYTPQAI